MVKWLSNWSSVSGGWGNLEWVGGGGGGWSGLHYTAVRNKRNVTGGNQSREKEQQGIVYSLRVYICLRRETVKNKRTQTFIKYVKVSYGTDAGNGIQKRLKLAIVVRFRT